MENVNEALTLIAQAKELIETHIKHHVLDNQSDLYAAKRVLNDAIDKLATK